MTGRALGKEGVAEMVTWPPGWRLPSVGETVVLGPGHGGIAKIIEWDLDAGLVRIYFW